MLLKSTLPAPSSLHTCRSCASDVQRQHHAVCLLYCSCAVGAFYSVLLKSTLPTSSSLHTRRSCAPDVQRQRHAVCCLFGTCAMGGIEPLLHCTAALACMRALPTEANDRVGGARSTNASPCCGSIVKPHLHGLQGESKAESNSLLRRFHHQLSSQEQELQVARAQVFAVQSDLAVSRSEVLQLRTQAQHKSTEAPPLGASCDVQTPAECQAGQSQAGVQQQASCEVQQAQLHKLRAELISANQRCNRYEAKLQAARAQYQEQQRRIASLENVVYDLKLHVSQSS